MEKSFTRVIAIVLGAITGVSVVEYTPSEARLIHQEDIPWNVGESGLFAWPLGWLGDKLNWLRWQYAEPGDIIVSGMWGSDLFLNPIPGGRAIAFPHYRSATDADLDQMLQRISKTREEMYLLSGGAAAAPYQPLGIFGATERLVPSLLSDGPLWCNFTGIAPFSGVITSKLSDRVGQDPFMRQSMGLHSSRAHKLYEGFEIEGREIGTLMGAGHVFEDNMVLECYCKGGKIRVIPCSHDSVFARLVGLAGINVEDDLECAIIFWTGSWLGTTVRVGDSIQPTAATFAAKINFEGLGSYRAAVTNTGMFGPIYKELIESVGFSGPDKYRQAAAAALPYIGEVDPVNPNEGYQIGPSPYPGVSIARYLNGVAAAMVEELRRVVKVLDVQHSNRVAITGGWAENPAFIQALLKQGIQVIVPRHASQATHAGLAADGLVRCGCASNIKEALGMLPELQ